MPGVHGQRVLARLPTAPSLGLEKAGSLSLPTFLDSVLLRPSCTKSSFPASRRLPGPGASDPLSWARGPELGQTPGLVPDSAGPKSERPSPAGGHARRGSVL